MSNCRPGRIDGSAGTGNRQMSIVKELFERWEQVCRAHQVGEDRHGHRHAAPPYIRRDLFVERLATPEGCSQEMADTRRIAPNARLVVHERTVLGDRAWQRVAIEWIDAVNGETRVHAGLQLLRFEAGRLVETWLMLSPPGHLLERPGSPVKPSCARQ